MVNISAKQKKVQFTLHPSRKQNISNGTPLHACVLAPRSGSALQRRHRASVRPEQPERTVTMSFSIGPTESQRQYRPPSSRPIATDPERHQLRPPAAGCPGEREGLWHRRTLFWRTSSGVQVVSPCVGARLVLGGLVSLAGGSDLDCAGIQCVFMCNQRRTVPWFVFFCTDGVYLLFKTARAFVTQYISVSNDLS